MTIPTIRIGGVDYDVIEDPVLTDVRLCGQIRWLRCQIAIAPSVHPQAKLQILLHEIVHGLLHNAGIDEQPENTVEAIAHGMMQVLRDNPELYKQIALIPNTPT